MLSQSVMNSVVFTLVMLLAVTHRIHKIIVLIVDAQQTSLGIFNLQDTTKR